MTQVFDSVNGKPALFALQQEPGTNESLQDFLQVPSMGSEVGGEDDDVIDVNET